MERLKQMAVCLVGSWKGSNKRPFVWWVHGKAKTNDRLFGGFMERLKQTTGSLSQNLSDHDDGVSKDHERDDERYLPCE